MRVRYQNDWPEYQELHSICHFRFLQVTYVSICQSGCEPMRIFCFQCLINSPFCMSVFSGNSVLCPRRPPAQSWHPRQCLASSFHAGRPFSSQAAEDRKEEPPHCIISSSETVQGMVQLHVLGSPCWLVAGSSGDVFAAGAMGEPPLACGERGPGLEGASPSSSAPCVSSHLHAASLAPSGGHPRVRGPPPKW